MLSCPFVRHRIPDMCRRRSRLGISGDGMPVVGTYSVGDGFVGRTLLLLLPVFEKLLQDEDELK
mgnify:CR=1 FL=1